MKNQYDLTDASANFLFAILLLASRSMLYSMRALRVLRQGESAAYDGGLSVVVLHFMFAIGKALDSIGERRYHDDEPIHAVPRREKKTQTHA